MDQIHPGYYSTRCSGVTPGMRLVPSASRYFTCTLLSTVHLTWNSAKWLLLNTKPIFFSYKPLLTGNVREWPVWKSCNRFNRLSNSIALRCINSEALNCLKISIPCVGFPAPYAWNYFFRNCVCSTFTWNSINLLLKN